MAVKSTQSDLATLKSRIVDAVKKAEGVLQDRSPEALVVDLGDTTSDVIKVRVSWWTRPRQHEMLTTYDHVLTAIRKALAEAAPQQSPAKPSRVA